MDFRRSSRSEATAQAGEIEKKLHAESHARVTLTKCAVDVDHNMNEDNAKPLAPNVINVENVIITRTCAGCQVAQFMTKTPEKNQAIAAETKTKIRHARHVTQEGHTKTKIAGDDFDKSNKDTKPKAQRVNTANTAFQTINSMIKILSE